MSSSDTANNQEDDQGEVRAEDQGLQLPAKLPQEQVKLEEIQVIHQVKQLATEDPAFAKALMHCQTTSDAATLAQAKGICISAEALWRHRGVLVRGGTPTWRG